MDYIAPAEDVRDVIDANIMSCAEIFQIDEEKDEEFKDEIWN